MDKQVIEQHKYLIVAATLAAILIILLSIYFVFVPVDHSDHESKIIKVKEGQGLKSIAQTLEDRGVIKSRLFFVIYAVLMREQSHLQAGDYLLNRSYNIPEIVEIIANGYAISDDVNIFFQEGSNIWDIDEKLATGALIKKGDFARQFYLREGYLFPDTYKFDKKATLSNIYAKLFVNFTSMVPSSIDTDIIVASILEKEARKKEDMELVAGIIYKRLKLKMPLQVDATVSYGWCLRRSLENNFSRDCDVHLAPVGEEIKIDGPFNTYTRSGLPLRSISNPGLVAIEAARHPKTSDYLYYLSTRDGSQLIYSKTAQEHIANRKKYLGF